MGLKPRSLNKIAEWLVNTFNTATGEDLRQIYCDYLDSQYEIADEDISVNSTYDIPITSLYVTEKAPAQKKCLIDLDDVMTTSKPYDDDCWTENYYKYDSFGVSNDEADDASSKFNDVDMASDSRGFNRRPGDEEGRVITYTPSSPMYCLTCDPDNLCIKCRKTFNVSPVLDIVHRNSVGDIENEYTENDQSAISVLPPEKRDTYKNMMRKMKNASNHRWTPGF